MQLDHERVRWHRDRLGWTLDTLAEKAEVAKGTVLRAEHGEDVRPSSGRRIARALGTEISDLVPDKPRRVEELVGTGKGEAPRETGRTGTPSVEIHDDLVLARERTPEQLLERLHEQGIQTNRSEVSILSQIIGMSDELVEEEPIDWQRLGWLLAYAAVSDLFTEDERQAARNPVREELAREQLAGYSLQFEDEQILMVSYANETTTWDEAWAQAREHAKEARGTHESKVTVRDNGEAVEVFVERGVTDHIRAARERARRDELKRANALDRERGRV